jgi:hypothetical protein
VESEDALHDRFPSTPLSLRHIFLFFFFFAANLIDCRYPLGYSEYTYAGIGMAKYYSLKSEETW